MCNLSKTLKMLCFASVCIFITCGQLLAQSNDVDKITAVFSGQITNQLSQFEMSVFEIQTNRLRTPNESFSKLAMAMEQLQGVVNSLEGKRSVNRKVKADLWFAILEVLDKRIDPNFGTPDYFKTNDCFLNLVPPPDGPGGPIYASGTSSEALKNPEARAEYKAMLKTNKEHINNVFFQDQLQRVNNQVMTSVERFIRSSYTSSESDKKELNEILDQSKLSNVRKKQLQNIVLQ